jgi:serine protease Do
MLLTLSVGGLSGCAFLSFTFPTISSTTESTVLPTFTTHNGTITLVNSDYLYYENYSSPAYDLTDVEEYSDLLLETRDLIRSSNVQIQTTVYETRIIWPGVTQRTISDNISGSGILFKEDDTYFYALTNFHVVDPGAGEAMYEIMAFGDLETDLAELVCYDAENDMAVLRFPKNDRTGLHLMNITTRLFRKMNAGEMVLAVGNPSGVENNVTFGEFVAFRTLGEHLLPVIEHSATIAKGSSGGALVDVEGNLLGINTWGSETDDAKSYSITVYEVYVFLYNNGLA